MGGDTQQAHGMLDGDKCYREKLDKLRCVCACVFMSRLGDGESLLYCINWLTINVKKALEQKFKGSDKIMPGNV